jgi:hypothetical protein
MPVVLDADRPPLTIEGQHPRRPRRRLGLRLAINITLRELPPAQPPLRVADHQPAPVTRCEPSACAPRAPSSARPGPSRSHSVTCPRVIERRHPRVPRRRQRLHRLRVLAEHLAVQPSERRRQHRARPRPVRAAEPLRLLQRRQRRAHRLPRVGLGRRRVGERVRLAQPRVRTITAADRRRPEHERHIPRLRAGPAAEPREPERRRHAEPRAQPDQSPAAVDPPPSHNRHRPHLPVLRDRRHHLRTNPDPRRRLGPHVPADLQSDLTDLDRHARLDRHRPDDACPRDAGAVRRAEVLDQPAVQPPGDPAMSPRGRRVLHT